MVVFIHEKLLLPKPYGNEMIKSAVCIYFSALGQCLDAQKREERFAAKRQALQLPSGAELRS